jgi:hypothetical protein
MVRRMRHKAARGRTLCTTNLGRGGQKGAVQLRSQIRFLVTLTALAAGFLFPVTATSAATMSRTNSTSAPTATPTGLACLSTAGGYTGAAVEMSPSYVEFSTPVSAPVVGVAATPGGGGYWFVTSDGGVYPLGGAQLFGSLGNVRLTAPVVGMASTLDGDGYWLAGADGGVFAFGDAAFSGSAVKLHLSAPVIGIAASSAGGGYRLAGADGGVFTFGDASFNGEGFGGCPVVGLATTGSGYVLGSDAGVLRFRANSKQNYEPAVSSGQGGARLSGSRVVSSELRRPAVIRERAVSRGSRRASRQLVARQRSSHATGQ